MGKAHTQGIKKQTDNPYLNMYEIDALQRDGRHFPYYIATRREKGSLMYETGELRADGVVIYPVYRQEPEKLVLLHQFRYPVNDYVYEVPAGLIDAGEDPMEAAVREMKEETGLDFEPYKGGDRGLSRPFIQSQGMSDECNITVFGYASGEISTDGSELREDIRVILADKKEAARILREELVSIRAAYLLLHFLQSSPEDPFAFLRF
jgi:ADP-ribose pyrophosphatase